MSELCTSTLVAYALISTRSDSTFEKMKVAAFVEERSLEPDGGLLVEGDPANHLMVIVEGQGVA